MKYRTLSVLTGVILSAADDLMYPQGSIHLVSTNPAGTNTISVINNGGGYSVTTTASSSDIPTKFRFYNIDVNNTHTYNVLRTIKTLNAQGSATASTYFCVGATCLPPSANTLSNPADYITLSPGNYDQFITYFNEIATIGYSEVYYKFFNVNNSNDTLGFTMYYNPLLNDMKENLGILENIEIYPVPAHDNIFIQAKANYPSELNITISNILGKTVMQQLLKISEGTFKNNIDISNLPNGVYFLTIQQAQLHQNIFITRKIIVNNL